MARTTKGRLYTRGKKGYYYLQYYVKGQQNRVALKDENGDSITKRADAEKAAAKILLPFSAKTEAERLRLVVNEMNDSEERAELAEIDLRNSAATLEKGWEIFMTCPSRPRSCKRAQPQNKLSMAKCYQVYYRHFCEWLAEKSPETKLLCNVTPEMAIDFMAELQTHTSPKTYNSHRFFLIAFFNCLMKDEKISMQKNPFSNVERLQPAPNSRRELSIAELQTIIETATGDMKLLLQIGTFTGLRLGDCCTLQWGEIDMVRQIIRRKPRKTASRTQKVVTLGIPRILYAILNEIPEEKRTGYLLPSYAETYLRPHGTSYITRMLQKHFTDCGIQIYAPGTGMKFHYEGKKKVYDESQRAIVQVGFHSLRHTWVSLHAMHGTPQAVIQDAAGHANPAMTEHYIHISPEAARKAATALDIPQLSEGDSAIIDVTPNEEPERAELHTLADSLPIEKIKKLLSMAKHI